MAASTSEGQRPRRDADTSCGDLLGCSPVCLFGVCLPVTVNPLAATSSDLCRPLLSPGPLCTSSLPGTQLARSRRAWDNRGAAIAAAARAMPMARCTASADIAQSERQGGQESPEASGSWDRPKFDTPVARIP
jgi:hypothetical protein